MNQKYLHGTLLYEDSANNMNRVVRLEDGSLFTPRNKDCILCARYNRSVLIVY